MTVASNSIILPPMREQNKQTQHISNRLAHPNFYCEAVNRERKMLIQSE